jgi:integrase
VKDEAIPWFELTPFMHAGDTDPAPGTAIYILLNTGARMGELRGLRLADVDSRRGVLTIRATTSKTAKERHIPINATLAARLRAHGTWAAPTRKKWDAILYRARLAKFIPHHARHDFLSRLANSGVPVHMVAALAGHSSIVLTGRYYLHTTDDALRAAVERTQHETNRPRITGSEPVPQHQLVAHCESGRDRLFSPAPDDCERPYRLKTLVPEGLA